MPPASHAGGDPVEHEELESLYLVVPPSDFSRMRLLLRLLMNPIGRRRSEQFDPNRNEEGRAAKAP